MLTEIDLRPHVEIHGTAGPYVLLVHGFLSSRAQWRPNLEALCHWCRPVIIELWAHGRSGAPDVPSFYTPDWYVGFFDALRAELNVDDWYIIGQSFGAGLTLRYSLTHPGRVRAQAFTNSVSALSSIGTAGDARKTALVESLRGDNGQAALEALPYHPRHARRFPPQIHREMIEDAAMIDPKGIAMAMEYTAPKLPVEGRLAQIEVPTLLINGRFEKSFKPLRDQASVEIKDIEIVDLDAGHSVNIEAAVQFGSSVADFFARDRD